MYDGVLLRFIFVHLWYEVEIGMKDMTHVYNKNDTTKQPLIMASSINEYHNEGNVYKIFF